MSPEQVQSSRDIDHRTDLWSLGSALYCALAGHAPHRHAESLGQLVFFICARPPPPLQRAAPWVPPEVAEAIHGALKLKPDERYPSAAAMLDALRPLLPDGFALRDHMLVPVPAEQREAAPPPPSSPPPACARPRAGADLDETRSIAKDPRPVAPDAALAPRGEVVEPLAKTVALGVRAAAPLDTSAAHDTTSRGTETLRSPSTAPASRASSLTKVALAGAVIAAGIGGAWMTQRRSGPAPLPAPVASADTPSAPAEPPPLPAPPAAPAASSGPSAEAIAIRRVKLAIIPRDASVEVDGAPVTVLDGLVEIAGSLDSEHRVRVFKAGMRELPETAVRVTEQGASPAKVELSPAAATSARPRPGPSSPGADVPRPPPAPPASAPAQAPPPRPKPGDDDIMR